MALDLRLIQQVRLMLHLSLAIHLRVVWNVSSCTEG